MPPLSLWDFAILAIAAYISIMALVRLMRSQRDTVVAQYLASTAAAQERKRAQELRERQQRVRAQQMSAFQQAANGDSTTDKPAA